MEEPKIYFRGVPEDEVEQVEGIVRDTSKGLEKYEGEIEKNEEEIRVINFINKRLADEVESLGLKPRKAIEYERLHFVTEGQAEILGMSANESGNYYPKQDKIEVVKSEEFPRLRRYRTLLHEMTHSYSYRSFMAVGETKTIGISNFGYESKNLDDDSHHEHFIGFNEAITEMVMLDIIEKFGGEFVKEFNISKNEIKDLVRNFSYYEDEKKIFDILLNKVAKFHKMKKEDLWTQIKRGYFSGDIMHLRKIEKVFGPGSLRVLASMSSPGAHKDLLHGTLFSLYNEYFRAKTNEERQKLANKILSERERLMHKDHVNKMTAGNTIKSSDTQ